jgi:Flp pilus assembly CpaF family ATPase
MFLTASNGSIFQIRNGRALIGSASDCSVRLTGQGIEPHHCEIAEDGAGKWSIVNLCRRPISVNGTVFDQGSLPLAQPSQVRISTHDFEVWESSNSGPIADTLRKRLFDFLNDLHTAVLDKLRNLPPAENEKEERNRIEAELEHQFRNTRLDPEFETYLASQALSGMLINRIHGYGIDGIPVSIDAATAAIVSRIESLLKIGEATSAPEKTEKVEALMPWVLRSQPDLLRARLRRDLALALLREHLIDLMFGLGPLGDLMQIPDVNDIMVLPSGHIFIERRGQMQDSGRKMLSSVVSNRIVERIVTRQGRRIDHASPMVDARVKDGSRLNAIIEPLAVDGPALTIRRFSDKRNTLEDLVARKTLPANVGEFLAACVMARKNIVISGGTGSGKTTLLNALAAKISPEERIVTVEDTAEMRLMQTHVITLQARPANLEGKGAVTIRDLVRNTLRMRPDRILVGECRGPETLDMLQAMNTGHAGSMTTIHSNSAQDAVRRLETMTMEADSKLPSRAIREQIASAVDIIIQITRMKDIRRVISVCEVGDFDEETESIVVEEIFSWRERRWKKGRISQGLLEFTGYVPVFFDDLLSHGAAMTCLVS